MSVHLICILFEKFYSLANDENQADLCDDIMITNDRSEASIVYCWLYASY